MEQISKWLDNYHGIDSYRLSESINSEKQCHTVHYCRRDEFCESNTKKDSKFWGKLFDTYYQKIDGIDDSVFNTDVWRNSYDGASIPSEEMQEWIANTVAQLKNVLTPKSNVLEIGCGNGLILSSIIDNIASYSGCDPAETALTSISNSSIGRLHKNKISLFHLEAIDIDSIPLEKFDLIIINSVAQYFPNTDYLFRFTEKLEVYTNENAHIFYGDIRSFDLQELFYFDISNFRLGGKGSNEELIKSVEHLKLREKETLYSVELFRRFPRVFPWIATSKVDMKNGKFSNELNKYRFDVMLSCKRVEGKCDQKRKVYDWAKNELTNSDLEKIFNSKNNPIIDIIRIPNTRILELFKHYVSIDGSKKSSQEINFHVASNKLDADISFYYDLAKRYDVDINVDYLRQNIWFYKVTLAKNIFPAIEKSTPLYRQKDLSNNITEKLTSDDLKIEEEILKKFENVRLIKSSKFILKMFD